MTSWLTKGTPPILIQDYLDFAPFVVPGFEANPKGILILYHALYPLVAAKQAMSGGEAPDRRTFSGCLNDELAQGPNRKKTYRYVSEREGRDYALLLPQPFDPCDGLGTSLVKAIADRYTRHSALVLRASNKLIQRFRNFVSVGKS